MLLQPLMAPPKRMSIPPVYRAITLELERRRIAVGISQDRMSELMGTAERSYAKMLHPETSSGRMVRWETLQSAVDVLFCDGYELRIKVFRPCVLATASSGPGVLTTEGTKRKIKAEAATWDRRIRREVLADLARLGGHARAAALPEWKREQIARQGGRAKARKRRQMLAMASKIDQMGAAA